MKKIILALPAAALLIASMTVAGCGDSKDKADSVKNVRREASAHDAKTNICFVNLDTLYSQYNLAKDMFDENDRMQQELASWGTKQEQSIQAAGNNLQTRAQAGQISQAAAEAEARQLQQRYQTLSAEGQKRAEATQKLMAANLKRLDDSIHNYLVDFNKTNKYDAILTTAQGAVLLYNPQLDVTAEVVKGLNARYKKAAKAEEAAPAAADDKK